MANRASGVPLMLLAFLSHGCPSARYDQQSPVANFQIELPQSPVALIGDDSSGGRCRIPITLRNDSRAPLVISVSSKSCTCIGVELPQQPLAAGGRAPAELLVPASAGTRRVSFALEGAVDRELPVRKTAELNVAIYPQREVTPRNIVRTVPTREAESIELNFRVHTSKANPRLADDGIRVEHLPSSLSLQSVVPRHVKPIADGVIALEWKLVLTCRGETGSNSVGSWHGEFQIVCGRLPPLSVPYHLVQSNELTVSPEVVYFDATPLGGNANRYAIVHAGSGDSLAVPMAHSNQSDFSIAAIESLSPITPGGPRMFRIKLRFAPSTLGACRSAITLSFNAPEKRQLHIVAAGRGVRPGADSL